MRMTAHARERWEQRCSHLDMDAELAAGRRAGKRLLNALRQNWERAQGTGTWPAAHSYIVTPGGCLFVISDGGYIITVLLTKDVKQWGRQRTADDRLRRRGALL